MTSSLDLTVLSKSIVGFPISQWKSFKRQQASVVLKVCLVVLFYKQSGSKWNTIGINKFVILKFITAWEKDKSFPKLDYDCKIVLKL